MSLASYRKKRHFDTTSEPRGRQSAASKPDSRLFVIQKHAATRLHYDFRLEHDGVLKSWAVPHGPSLDPAMKSLAVQVEDHPLEYADFEGTIPKGEYGGGTVMVWDRGTWTTHEDVSASLKRGKLTLELHGTKLHGSWTLVRMHGKDSENWLLIKKQDSFAQPNTGHAILEQLPRSVSTDRTLSEIADHQPSRPSSQRGTRSSRSRAGQGSQTKSRATARRALNATVEDAVTSSTRDSRRPSEPATNIAGLNLAMLPRRPMPQRLTPQLATLVKQSPAGPEWVHEIKLDGYRVLARFDNQRVSLWTRGGQDWTSRFPHIVKALERLKLDASWMDGEVVVQDAQGFTNFQLLQNALAREDDREIVYYVFDLPWLDSRDLTGHKLVERKQLLQHTLHPYSAKTFTDYVQYHEHLAGSGQKVLDSACQLKLEGIVSKLSTSSYESKRTTTWQKTKCEQVEEFIIAGYTKPHGQRQAFGALLLGIYRDDALVYCGRVGTGFTQDSLKELKRRFAPLRSDDCPFTQRPTTAQQRGVHWLQPKLVAQISYATRTADGLLRHSVFHGLREDMDPEDVVEPKPGQVRYTKTARRVAAPQPRTKPPKKKSKSQSIETAQAIEVSHPERVVYPDLGITKAEVVAYYEQVSSWILPGLIGRPLTVLRCPHGIGQASFFQKHFEAHVPAHVYGVPIQEDKDVTTYATIKNVAGLLALAQWNVIELHPWPALAKHVERPDRLIFDLDPGEGATWSSVVQAAREIRQLLRAVELESFVRTSGGKGLHVVTPLRPGSLTWDELKSFSRLLAQTLAKQHPERITATLSKAARRGKVFVDYLRNGRGATAIASYSLRARPGAHVAMPLRWRELSEKTTNDQYSITNVIKLLKRRTTNPWEGFSELKQSLPKL